MIHLRLEVVHLKCEQPKFNVLALYAKISRQGVSVSLPNSRLICIKINFNSIFNDSDDRCHILFEFFEKITKMEFRWERVNEQRTLSRRRRFISPLEK